MTSDIKKLLSKYKQFYNTLEEPKRSIQKQVDRYFKRHIEIEQRTFQAFEFMPTMKGYQISTVWRNALLFYPAIACILQGLYSDDELYSSLVRYLSGIDTQKISNSNFGNNTITSLLQKLFRDPVYKTTLGNRAMEIQQFGKLNLIDILLASVSKPISNQYYNPVINNTYKSIRTEDIISNTSEAYKFTTKFQSEVWKKFNFIKGIDPSLGEQQFLLYHDQKKFRIEPFATWSSSQYVLKNDNLIHTQRENVIQINSPFSNESLEHLEYLINSNAQEKEFQFFFNKYPNYLTTLGDYTKIHSQLILHEDDGKAKIPDFFLERFDNKFCDICELKRPTDKLIKETYNLRTFRDKVNIALQQINNYRNFFDDKSNRDFFFSTYGLNAFKPRVILIIGRKNSFYDDLERIKLEDKLFNENIKLFTYDDIISNAKRWLSYASR